MAETSTLAKRVDARLQAAARRVAALPEYARRDDLDRVALEAEWRETLDRLSWLDEQRHAEGFTPDQSHRHQQLIETLAEHAALVQQLGLPSPPPQLMNRTAHRAGTPSLADSA